MTTPTYPPQLTGDQVTLLGLGVRAIVAAPVLAWASLANGQTFVTITPAGAADSRTINAALALSTDRPTFCAALALELNTAGTTAYTWTVNTSSPVDGLIGTAKNYGSAYNSAPTGTALVGGAGSVTTRGGAGVANDYGNGGRLIVPGFDFIFSEVASASVPGLTRMTSAPIGVFPAGVSTIGTNFTASLVYTGGGILANNIAYGILTTPIVKDPSAEKWAVGFDFQVAVATAAPVQYTTFGLVNVAATENVTVNQAGNVGLGQYYLTSYRGSAGPNTVGGVANANRRSAIITHDLITLRMFIDGVEVASSTDLSKLPNTPCRLAAQTSTTGMQIFNIAWAL